MPPLASPRGVALVATLLAIGLLSALAGGLMVSSVLGRAIGSNHEAAAELANAADAALALTVRELSDIADWDRVLGGLVASTRVDGPPGVRTLAGRTVDLETLTNELTCGRATPCSNAQILVATAARPWGANNPRWRLFLHQVLPVAPMPRPSGPIYVAAWIGDDGRETDGDSALDGAGPGQEGRYVVRARVEAFGPRGGRHALEAELARACTVVGGVESCLPGVRVQSWRAVPRRRRRRRIEEK